MDYEEFQKEVLSIEGIELDDTVNNYLNRYTLKKDSETLMIVFGGGHVNDPIRMYDDNESKVAHIPNLNWEAALPVVTDYFNINV